MNLPFLYTKFNTLQRNDAAFLLNNYFQMTRWKNNNEDAILDIGCGPGDVTTDILLPFLPKSFGKLVGIDISEDMINFAKTHYKNSKISFKQMNIEAEEVPVTFEKGFDHIFSFYCLHWIQNPRKALENIMKMLKPGGDILLTFLATNPIYDIYISHSKNSRWKSYMKDLNKYLSPFHNSENQKTELETLLKDVGFQVEVCKVEKKTYVYPTVDNFKESLAVINPYYRKIPNNLKNEYVSDCITEARQLNLVQINDNNEECVNIPYTLFIVCARKTF